MNYSMIIDQEGTSSKYGHLCPLVDKRNAPLPQKALIERYIKPGLEMSKNTE